ncbi:MAG: AMP-binding protein [Propionibacteriaceae bacterium]
MRAALDSGPAFAPLPLDPAERGRAVELLSTGTAPPGSVVVTTSGSTGSPKAVVLPANAIRASAQATHDRLGGPRDWVLALPTHYVAGLMVLARAAVGGTRVTTVGGDLAGLPAAVADLDRPYLAVVPTQLRRGLDDAATTAALAGCDTVLLGGGPAEPTLVAVARDAGIALVTTYGMSETCGGCVYDGVPLDGVRLDLAGDRVRLGGPTLFAGYWNRPDLTDAVLTDGWFVTSDRGRLVDDRLQVPGRVDDVVISGGLNVDLAEVERVAQGWPGRGRTELVVLGVPDPEWGTAVVAVLEGVAAPVAELKAWLAGRLPAYAAPRSLLGRTELPRTSGGKIDRRTLVAQLTSTPTDAPE